MRGMCNLLFQIFVFHIDIMCQVQTHIPLNTHASYKLDVLKK